MIFSELYSVYYNTVAEILKAAIDHPLGKNELRRIVEERAFIDGRQMAAIEAGRNYPYSECAFDAADDDTKALAESNFPGFKNSIVSG